MRDASRAATSLPGRGAGRVRGLPCRLHQLAHQTMLKSMSLLSDIKVALRTTINIDDELLAKASRLAGPLDRSAVVHEGLRALIQRESARRLARLGGSEPALKAAPRRRAGTKP